MAKKSTYLVTFTPAGPRGQIEYFPLEKKSKSQKKKRKGLLITCCASLELQARHGTRPGRQQSLILDRISRYM